MTKPEVEKDRYIVSLEMIAYSDELAEELIFKITNTVRNYLQNNVEFTKTYIKKLEGER